MFSHGFQIFPSLVFEFPPVAPWFVQRTVRFRQVGQLSAISECDLCCVEPVKFGHIVALIRRAMAAMELGTFHRWGKKTESN